MTLSRPPSPPLDTATTSTKACREPQSRDDPVPQSTHHNNDSHQQEEYHIREGAEAVEPPLHIVTSALYIQNFMRPLQAPMVEEHHVNLATPAGQAPDLSLMVDFYLDQIRTHAFVLFKTASAAIQVRTALHNHVWPDERTRKPLWVDFVPPDKINGWIEREQSDGGSHNSLNKWEVVYESIGGRVEAELHDVGCEAKPQVALYLLHRLHCLLSLLRRLSRNILPLWNPHTSTLASRRRHPDLRRSFTPLDSEFWASTPPPILAPSLRPVHLPSLRPVHLPIYDISLSPRRWHTAGSRTCVRMLLGTIAMIWAARTTVTPSRMAILLSTGALKSSRAFACLSEPQSQQGLLRASIMARPIASLL